MRFLPSFRALRLSQTGISSTVAVGIVVDRRECMTTVVPSKILRFFSTPAPKRYTELAAMQYHS